MVSKEIDNLIIHKFFSNLLEDTNSIEILREVLLQQKEFNANTIFLILDKNNKNSVDEYDILSFLK